jgi:hypothetical protein
MTDPAVDFDLDKEGDDDTGLPPLCSFRLGGHVWHVKNEDLISLALINQVTSQDGVQVIDYFHAVLVPEEWPAFTAMLAKPPDGMTIGKVRAAMRKTADRVLGFPTTVDSGSSTTSPARARKPKRSAAASSAPGTRRKASGE